MNATNLSPIATRFAWKEYRTLRGLWLAVLTLGVLVQTVLMLLAAPGADVPTITFAAAWGTAVLYAIGAAAILFSVEHEEETYGFLAGLPTRWLPLYLGKLCVATASAFAAAVALMLTGWAVAGGRWPTSENMGLLVGLLGIGVVEAIAWGTLFSLLLKRPLVAVLWTIVVGAVAVHWAVNTASSASVASLDLNSYSEAIPLRLAIAVLAFAATALAARRWLAADRPRAIFVAEVPDADANITGYLPRVRNRSATSFRVSRRGMLARILWQSWRQSWKSLLMPAIIAAFLTIAVAAATAFVKNYMLVASTALFLPALYGAMVFGADQRRRQYLFLAEHAAWPRYVWLTRHLVWGGALLVIVTLVLGFGFSVLSTQFYDNVRQFVHNNGWRYSDQNVIAENLLPPVELVALAASPVVCGLLLAYAVGQFFSMLLRSEIMAAFAACIASVLICAWSALTTVWGLSSLWFVLPLAVGVLGTTWLRAPNWIIERNSWRHWLRPAAATLVPFVLVVASVPSARLAQIPENEVLRAEMAIAPVRDKFIAGDTAAARETAAMCFRAADLLDSWQTHDPLAKWSQYEVLDLDKLYGVDARKRFPNGIDASKIPPAQSVAFEAAVREYWKLKDEAQAAALKEFFTASARPTCRFDFDLSYAPLRTSYPSTEELERNRARLDPQYQRLNKLTIQLTNVGAGGQVLDDHLAALRATAHLRSGQPSIIFYDQLSLEAGTLRNIVHWAREETTTDEEIRLAIKQLLQFFSSLPDPAEAIWADHNLVADVLAGEQPPLVFANSPFSWQTHLAYLLHQLPWERDRARSVLDLLTAGDLRRVNGLTRFLREGSIRDRPYRRDTDWPYRYFRLRESMKVNAAGHGDSAMSNRFAAMNFGFVAAEYDARTHARDLELQLVDTEMHRRATLLQLALELNRRDHDEYPNNLQELAPEYLKKVPIDPYSGTPFNYLPNGTDLPVVDALDTGGDIAPGTPFFWSVGPHNLTKLIRTAEWRSEERDSEDRDVIANYTPLPASYRFWTQDFSWYWGMYLGVFPLPK